MSDDAWEGETTLEFAIPAPEGPEPPPNLPPFDFTKTDRLNFSHSEWASLIDVRLLGGEDAQHKGVAMSLVRGVAERLVHGLDAAIASSGALPSPPHFEGYGTDFTFYSRLAVFRPEDQPSRVRIDLIAPPPHVGLTLTLDEVLAEDLATGIATMIQTHLRYVGLPWWLRRRVGLA